MPDRNSVFRYILIEHFGNDVDRMSYETGFSANNLIAWRDKVKVPQRKTVEYLLNIVFTPEFKVVSEFFELDAGRPIQPQLKEMYKGHEQRSGIYAFYDGMTNLVYLGKAKNLLEETYSAIRREHELIFPAGIKNQGVARHQVVRYISAYDVKVVGEFDYPKHVESLILRISKPIMNKQIGRLEAAYPTIEE
jgi:hypothetical protein